ncbi:L-2-hydroxyglutarate dehydrogenase mitochondrial [Spathaspora sp. JA1]|nr:L-2-hydroxyglutarate dehydrogenase mitochondrial [Spathaspora sp. JA1]
MISTTATRTLTRHFSRCLTTSAADFDFVVIGGGIVGTAIAGELQSQFGNTLLLEQHSRLGTETSARNSEVVHAGLYYPVDSLKARLCIEGKHKIYNGDFQGFKQCGKWVVAQTEAEEEMLNKLYENARNLNVDARLISSEVARRKNPLIRAEKVVLVSPTTGILDSHEYLTFHQSRFENEEGIIATNSKVTEIEYSSDKYTLTIHDSDSGENTQITSANLVNSGGLYAPKIANLLVPKERHYKTYLAKGNYFSFQPATPIRNITDVLVYPAPNPQAASLGTHLTFDMAGQIRFGPDLEWLDIDDPQEIDYTPNANNLPLAYEAVKRYFPSIPGPESLIPDYSGVRPKIFPRDSKSFPDFVIKKEEGFPGFVNLLGIESPGLTASWGIAQYVADLYK